MRSMRRLPINLNIWTFLSTVYVALASCRRYCFGAVVAGASVVVAGELVEAGVGGAMVLLRFQNTATKITATITATIAYQKRLSPKKFIASSLF